MTEVQIKEECFPLRDGESVLDGLLRVGLNIPNGCRAGVCQACLLQVVEGSIPPKAQTGLKSSQKQLGYFLSCQCVPSSPLRIQPLNESLTHQATVLSVGLVADAVLRLRIEPVFDYLPGQYLNIWYQPADFTSPLIRSYSIASVPALDDFIEMHVKVMENGRFSTWARAHLRAGDPLRVQGPLGQCVYLNQRLDQTMLLAGIGTGLAPLYGIVRDALRQGHRGSIYLIIGAKTSRGFYYQTELAELATEFDNLHVSYVSQADSDGELTDIYQYVQTKFPSLKGFRIYLCGAATFVRKMKKQCFLAGAPMQDIHSDAFLPCTQ